ncbi:MAG: phosphatidate cytidylyltransferase [Thiotrichales bacterium]|nr:phosphatidate cytidylyltransferase [Thiotrichales bacterium]
MNQRIISSIVLAPLLIVAIIYLEGDNFTLLLALLLLPAAWEWVGISVQSRLWLRVAYSLMLTLIFYTAHYYLQVEYLLQMEYLQFAIFGIALLWWLAATLWLRYFSVDEGSPSIFFGVRARRSPIPYLAGVVVLIPAWLALDLIKQQSVDGSALFFLLGIIWSADIGAYFAGRRFGRRKLAPNVSPGKTVEGVVGGVMLALIFATVVAPLLLEISISSMLIISVAALVLFSVVGDLVESCYKRSSGVKDSGSLIPGHGGILDRVDSLTAAAPLFYLLFYMVDGGL